MGMVAVLELNGVTVEASVAPINPNKQTSAAPVSDPSMTVTDMFETGSRFGDIVATDWHAAQTQSSTQLNRAELSKPVAPDQMTSQIGSAASKPVIADATSTIATRDDFQPPAVRSVSTNPAQTATPPTTELHKPAEPDSLPLLRARSTIKAMLFVADPIAPAAARAVADVLAPESDLPYLPPNSVLQVIVPGNPPDLKVVPPKKLLVFDGPVATLKKINERLFDFDLVVPRGSEPVDFTRRVARVIDHPTSSGTLSIDQKKERNLRLVARTGTDSSKRTISPF